MSFERTIAVHLDSALRVIEVIDTISLDVSHLYSECVFPVMPLDREISCGL